MPEPQQSILPSFRNAADTLGQCLDSISRQTVSDFVLLAVDDGSTDGSARIV